MPLVGGIILAGLLVGVVIALSKSAGDGGKIPPGLPPAPGTPLPSDDEPLPTLPKVPVTDDVPPIPDVPPPKKPRAPRAPETPNIVTAAIEAIQQGTATPDMLNAAIDAAKKAGLTAAAAALAQALDRLMLEKIPALVRDADKAGEPIPVDKKTGKKLWFMDVRKGIKSAIPNFPGVLVQFKALQAAIGGVKVDGRIGPGTTAAFVKKVSALGFERFPDTQEKLAANAVKWTEVLNKHFSPGQVGRPFDVPARQWREFVARVNSDWDKLAPKVQERLGSYIGTVIDGEEVTKSGLYGVVARAGIRGAEQWLKSEKDRKRFPNTTLAFKSTNGIF